MLVKAGSEDVPGADAESRQRERTGAPGALVCAQCRNLVTSRAAAISMAGQVSLCRQCGAHLGRLFRSPDARFFGLILDHLTPAD
jgi:NAD-dependent SIR2 family protein deacetylase